MTTERNALCPCGSGTKYKRCCLAADTLARAAAARPQSGKALNTTLSSAVIGIPGEETNLTITPVFVGGREPSPAGVPGEYEIIFMLRRPDSPIEVPANFSFETVHHKGTSQLAIANPAAQFADPRFNGPDTRINIYVATDEGVQAVATGFPNEEGYLSDVRVTIVAASFADASKKARLMLNPALSALSFACEVPVMVSHTVVREISTEVVRRTVEVPFPASPVTMLPHAQTPEVRTLLNMYRDAVNSTDPNWRFLCFSRIVEQLWKLQRARVAAGQALRVDLEAIGIPTTDEEIITWVRAAFPVHYTLADHVYSEVVPSEARGLTTNDVIVKFTRPIRNDIAHSLLNDGVLSTEKNDVEHLERVRRWLPMLRCISRVHLGAMFSALGLDQVSST